MYEFLALPRGLYSSPPNTGENVMCVVGEPKRLYAGKVVEIQGGEWGVMDHNGVIWKPKLHDVIPHESLVWSVKSNTRGL